ncbi:MAG: hypothetical protein KDA41_21510, partial [Planctomycetales bacterium]|nr:hypothetical protein [Planctomycetales bacterium]
IARSYGDGRVLAFAGDSTHLWVRHGKGEAFDRFWRQSILWLAKRDEDQKDDLWIDLPQRRFTPGGRVEFTTGVKRAGGASTDGLSLTAQVTLPDGTRQPARLAAEGDRFLGLFKETAQAGSYTIEVQAAGIDRTARTRFVVLDEDLELGNPSANPDALDALAEITKEYGGRRVSPEGMLEILREIKNSPPELQEEVQERFELGRTPATAWLFFVLILALLGGDWYLRKRWGLV